MHNRARKVYLKQERMMRGEDERGTSFAPLQDNKAFLNHLAEKACDRCFLSPHLQVYPCLPLILFNLVRNVIFFDSLKKSALKKSAKLWGIMGIMWLNVVGTDR